MDGTAVENIRDLTIKAVDIEPKQAIIAPEGHQVHYPDPFTTWPSRVLRQVVELRSPESFVAYAKRYQQDSTVVFVNERRRRFEARLEYHHNNDKPLPDAHRASFTLELHHAFETWLKFAEAARTQTETLEFLEDHLVDITDPPAADIMDVCGSLELTSSGSFKSSKRLADGNVELAYSHETKPAGSIVVPEILTLKTPVFVGLEPIEWKMRLRYRMREGALKFAFVPQNVEKLMDDTFARVAADMRVSLSVLNPAPLVLDGVAL